MKVLDLFRLNDKVAVVAGASSGLGADFAVALAEAGADAPVHHLTEAPRYGWRPGPW